MNAGGRSPAAMPPGPLAASLHRPDRPNGSWWADSLPPEPARPPLVGESGCEVAIIGAGYAGLSAALSLAETGRRVAVLDAGAVGWGSAGRSGGICGPGGDKLPAALFERRHGRGAAGEWTRLQGEAVDWVRRFCERAGLAEHLQGAGERILAHGPAIARALARAADGDPDATPVAPSGQDDIARFGGILVRPAFGLNPLAYVRALARAAEAAGATIHEASPVTALGSEGGRHRLVTPDGGLRADALIVATNGFTPLGLHPGLDGLAIPVISNIAVTRPLAAEERARHPWLDGTPSADTRHMLAYFRLLPDGRLLFGARGNPGGSEAGMAAMRRHVGARIARDLPGFADAEITHFWQGPIAATTRLTPTVAWLDREARIAVALGWHGSGIAMGSLGGRLAARLVASNGEAAIPAPMAGLPRRLPLPRRAPLAVGAAIAALRLADWWTGLDAPWARGR